MAIKAKGSANYGPPCIAYILQEFVKAGTKKEVTSELLTVQYTSFMDPFLNIRVQNKYVT